MESSVIDIGKRSVIRKGSSLLVTIPAKATKWMNLKAGNIVLIRYDPVYKQLLIEKMTKSSLKEGEEILLILQETNAYFDKGHYILSSGRHSDRYVFARLAASHKDKRLRIAYLMASHFEDNNINVVAGFTVGGALLANEVAQLLGAKFVVGRKIEEGKVEFEDLFKIEQGDRILVVDDVLTTGGSIKKAIDAIKSSERGDIKGVAILVDRSKGKIDFGNVKTVGLIKLDLKQYDKETCQLCQEGLKKVDLSKVERDRNQALSVLNEESRILMTKGFQEYEKMLDDARQKTKKHLR